MSILDRRGWTADTRHHEGGFAGSASSAVRRSRVAARLVRGICLFLLAAIGPFFASAAHAQGTFGCSPAMVNDIVCENTYTGSPSSVWDVGNGSAGDPSIQGFATDISVAQGGTIYFKVNTSAAAYRLDVYRMGYYAGNGARLITSLSPSVSLPQTQPACMTDASTNLYDCGDWAVSASWNVPANATSGIYFANLVRTDTGGHSHIVFVVRNDSSHSDILFQTSDEAWQAYNDWGGNINDGVLGGNTLYGGPGAGNWDDTNRAYKVSYNRPFDTRAFEAATWVFGNEYPMVRFLEANGFNVTYFTHVDAMRNADLITNHKIYMSVGHDEYWAGTERANVQAAANAGVNLAFFSGNEVFWKTRWEDSIDGSNTPYRTLVCYKETYPEAQIDPDDPPTWTGTWRDPTFSPPDDGGQPENGFTGTLFMVNGPGSDDTGISIKVPQADGQMRFWRNTSEAKLASGATATLPAGTLGFEWDVDPDNGFRPAGTFDLSTASYNLTADYLLDYGVTYGAGTAVHHMTEHRLSSGALVFGAGTVQWTWGLDSNHDNMQGFNTPAASTDMQQATLNLLADMGVQPTTVMSGLLLATQSTDTTPPVSTITSPAAGADLSLTSPTTIQGTSTDSGGGVVAGVEVSVNGGSTWHPAAGRGSWAYTFTPQAAGEVTIMSRAADDSGNIETPGPGVTVSAGTTYSITGTISPIAAGDGAQVQLIGTSTTTVTANSSGVYTFAGVSAGSYTVAPSQSGYSFNPASTLVTVSGANVTGVNFTGTASVGSTYSISGSVSPASSASGVTITVTGTSSATTTPNGSGVFTVPGLPNGNYTVTPSKSNFSFSPPQSAVTVSGSNVTNLAFTAASTSQTLFTTQTPAQINQSDGTNVNYELGTLFQSSTIGQITAIRFWKTSDESGTHSGHIWSSSGALLATVTFTGETASGWQQQLLATPLQIAANTTYVVSVNTGNTYYVDTQSGLATQIVNANLSSVVGNDGVYGSPGTFPTSSYQNSNYFRDVDFVPGATYSVSGTFSPSAAGVGATVTLTLNGATVGTTTATSSGYTFTGVPAGNYTVTPVENGYTFSPASATADVSNANVTVPAFTANAVPTYTVSGSVTGASSATLTLSLNGTTMATTTEGSNGSYSFTGISNGNYVVTPAQSGYAFSPTSAAADVSNGNVTVTTFAGTPSSQTLFTTQTPTVTNASDGSGVNYELGTAFTADTAGQITAVRFWKASDESGTHTGHIWSSSGTLLVTVTFSGETASGWQQQALTTPLSISANTAYIVSVNTGNTYYVGTTGGLATQINNGDLHSVVGNNGLYGSPGTFPTSSYQNTNYFRDIVFTLASDPVITANAGTPQSAAAGSAFTTALQALVMSNGNPVSGATVTFTAPSTGASGTFAGGVTTATTNSSGLATAPAFTANTVAGTYTVTATVAGATTPASFSLTNTPGSAASISATAGTPQNAVINKAFASSLQATVVDSDNNPVSGVSVTFTAPASGASGLFGTSTTAQATTNSSGVATAPAFTANGTTGSYTVAASTTGVSNSAIFSLTNTAAPAGSITATAGSSQSATVGTAFANTLQATVKDTNNNPMSGVTVTFTAPASGASGTFAGGVNTATTNSSGVATSAAFTANNVAGSYAVSASVSGVSTSATFSLTNLAGTAASIAATAGTPQSATVSTAFATALQATVKDGYGNPIGGVTVTFTVPVSGASGTFAGGVNTATTSATGVATAAAFTANSTTGSYTVSASVTGVSSSASFSLTNSATPVIAIDITKSTDRGTASKTIASPSFSTAATNELLLAFICSDSSSGGTNVAVSSVAGGSLTWTLVKRTNTQRGTAEIWRAFATTKLSSVTVTGTLSQSVAASITVMSFTGVNTGGTGGSGAIGAVGSGNADPGAPTASLVTTATNSLVIGVGDDWDNSIARTLGPNQVMIHQDLATSVGDTYWVQRVTTAYQAGTTVTVNDTAPTTDRYNLSICEILP